MPEARGSRDVWVKHRHRETPRLLGKAGPAQLRRDVQTARSQDAAHLLTGQLLAVGYGLRGQREGPDPRHEIVRAIRFDHGNPPETFPSGTSHCLILRPRTCRVGPVTTEP